MKPVTFALTMLMSTALAAPTESTGAALAARDPAPVMNAVAVMKSETKFADQVNELVNKNGASHKRDLARRESAEKAQLASQAQEAVRALQTLAANKALANQAGGAVSNLLIKTLVPLVQRIAQLLSGLGLKRDEGVIAERAGGDLVSTLLGTVTNLLNGLLGGLLGPIGSGSGSDTGTTGSTGSGSGPDSATSLPDLPLPDLNSLLGSLTGATSGAGAGSDPDSDESGSFPDISSAINSILGGVSKRNVDPSGLLGVVSKVFSTIAVDMQELKPAAAKFAEAAELAKQVAKSHAAQKKKGQ